MKNTSKNIGVQTSKESINYFEYARQNPEKGKVISHAEAMRKIMDAKSQKLKEAS